MERKSRFLLNATDVFRPEKQLELLQQAGSADALLSKPDWLQALSAQQREAWLRACDVLEREHRYEKLLAEGVRFVLQEDDEYPASLQYVDTPPHLLYIKGQLPAQSLCGISVIGTRTPTLYGRQMAQYFAQGLASEGMVILSGCARGIDSTAMSAALDVGGSVVGVLGTGIDKIYPSENGALFKKITENGALVSEFPPGAKPLKHHFPWRNRLISGWALGLLVVEAKIRSGTSVTVNWALAQGKEVFAVPGPVNSELSRGTHKMIREGAILVEKPSEILDCFSDVMEARRAELREQQLGCLDPEETELGLISEPRSLEDLMEITGKNQLELLRLLNREVVEGRATKWPGQMYSLKK